MVGEQLVCRVQLLNEREEAGELLRRVDIRRVVAELAMHLRERRTTQSSATVRRIDVHEHRLATIET